VVQNTLSQALNSVPDPQNGNSAINRETMNIKIHSEIEKNQLEALKYLRRDGQNQVIEILQLNNNRIVALADPEERLMQLI